MLPLFIYATKLEAQALFEAACFKQVQENLWQSPSCFLLISGMGALEASYHFQKALQAIPAPSHIINMGVAASLTHFKAFECVQISQVSKCLEQEAVDSHSKHFFDKLFPTIETLLLEQAALPLAKLISVDCPIHHSDKRKKMALAADVLDMEGYALAHVAKQENHKIYIIKCISDYAQDEGWEVLQQNLARCREKLASTAILLLSKIEHK
jgi:adenosylhomocysteine nucleosidase